MTGTGQDEQVSVELVNDALSVSTARHVVSSALRGWGLDRLTETAALLTSELATNALLHARSSFLLAVERSDLVVRVTVYDDSPAPPRQRSHGLQAGTGRGLGLVGLLAVSWGTSAPRSGRCKGVWFEVPLAADRAPDVSEGALYGEAWLAMADDL